MKSTVEHLNPTRVKLTVEVPFDELGPNFDKAYKSLASQVRVPGFRPGKVPARILDARVGRGAILSEVVNDAVPVKYGQAVEENAITPLGQPDIEVTKIEDGEVLSFTAEVDVRPEFTLPEFSDIAVTVDNVEVTEADIDEQVDALRERFSSTTEVDRAAADGDLVTLDLRATVDGEPLADATADDLSYTVGSGDLVDGIDAAITGLSAGQDVTFTTQLVAGEFADQDAEVTATVKAVKERELPAVDDDFAQEASEFDTVEQLRADLAEKIQRVKNQQQGSQARDKVLEALLAATDIPVPEGVAKAEFESREHDVIHSLGHDEAAYANWLLEQGQTKEEFQEELKTASAEAVQTQLLLDAMAEVTQVGVSQEEFTERVIFNAQRFGVSPDEYFKRLQENNQLGAVFADVRRGKALAHAVQLAKVSDESGNLLDVAALFGFETLEEDDAEELIEDILEDSADEDSADEDSADEDSADDADQSEEDTKA